MKRHITIAQKNPLKKHL